MDITIKTTMCRGTFEIDPDANIVDTMDVITAALLAEGYALESIRDEFYRRTFVLGYKNT